MIFQREAAAHFAGSVSPFQVRIHHRSLPGAMISVTLITDDTLDPLLSCQPAIERFLVYQPGGCLCSQYRLLSNKAAVLTLGLMLGRWHAERTT